MIKSHPKNYAVVSYIPLLYPDQQDMIEVSPESIQARVNAHDVVSLADACIWIADEQNVFTACLIYDRAEEIAEHFYYFSENNPQSFFDAHFTQSATGNYTLALIPRIKVVQDRFRLSYQLRTGFPLPKNVNIAVYFDPLHINAKRDPLDMSRQSTLRVSLLPRKVLDGNRDNILTVFEHQALGLGTFPLRLDTLDPDSSNNVEGSS